LLRLILFEDLSWKRGGGMAVLRVETAISTARNSFAMPNRQKIGKSLYGDARGVQQSLEKAGGQLLQFQRARALTEGFGKELILETLLGKRATGSGRNHQGFYLTGGPMVPRFCTEGGRLPPPSESSNFFYGVEMLPDEGHGLFSTLRKLL
jgi:hypothetical protein